MTQHNAAPLLWKLAITAGGGAVLSVVLAVTLPLDLPTESATPSSQSPTAANNLPADAMPSLSQWSKVWSVDLGHDVAAASSPPPSTQVAAVQTPPPDLHLIGTIIEPGHSAAILIGPAGKTLFLHVGDQIQGATIRSIANNSITIDFDGRSTTYSVEKPAPLPTIAKPTAIPPEDQ